MILFSTFDIKPVYCLIKMTLIQIFTLGVLDHYTVVGYIKLEILQSLGGLYDGLAFYPLHWS